MSYKILTNDIHKIICRSNIWSAVDPSAPNLHLEFSNEDYTSSIPPLSDDNILYLI